MNEDDMAECIDEAIRYYNETRGHSFNGMDVTVLNYGDTLEIELPDGQKYKVEVTKL